MRAHVHAYSRYDDVESSTHVIGESEEASHVLPDAVVVLTHAVCCVGDQPVQSENV